HRFSTLFSGSGAFDSFKTMISTRFSLHSGYSRMTLFKQYQAILFTYA